VLEGPFINDCRALGDVDVWMIQSMLQNLLSLACMCVCQQCIDRSPSFAFQGGGKWSAGAPCAVPRARPPKFGCHNAATLCVQLLELLLTPIDSKRAVAERFCLACAHASYAFMAMQASQFIAEVLDGLGFTFFYISGPIALCACVSQNVFPRIVCCHATPQLGS
jgi:hypothetical protein